MRQERHWERTRWGGRCSPEKVGFSFVHRAGRGGCAKDCFADIISVLKNGAESVGWLRRPQSLGQGGLVGVV